MKKRGAPLRPLAIAVASAVLASALGAWGLLDRFELPTIDARFRAQRSTVDPRILMVDVDQDSLDTFGWPVPRENYALLLMAAAQAKASGVVFDVEFADPSADAAADRAFAASIAMVPTVLPLELGVAAKDRPDGIPHSLSAHPPLAAFAEHAHLAHLQVDNKPDGVGRRQPPVVWNQNALVPSLGLAGARFLDASLDGPAELHGRTLSLGKHRLPVSRDGFVAVDFRPIPEAQRISLHELVAELNEHPDALAQRLNGKLLFVGYSARSVGDRGPLPLASDVPLVNLHAHLADTLLNGRALRAASWGENLVAALALSVLIALICLRLSTLGSVLASLAAVLGYLGLAAVAFWQGRVELAFTAPTLAGALTYAGTLLLLRQENEAQVKHIRSAFEKYVAPSILNRIMEDPSALNVAGKEAELAILFSDVQGYTSLSNRLPPQQVLALLRTYLDVMSKIVLEHEGTIDKIMGDGILCFFGDPIPSKNPSERAVRCGLAMQEAMLRLSAQWLEEGYGEMRIRVGIATGTVYVGNIGSSDHLEYTVIGPSVNLAARLESNAPPGKVLVSERTKDQCAGEFEFEHVTGLKLKGFGTDCEAFLCRGPVAKKLAGVG